MTWATVVGAVTTASVQLADIDNSVVCDGDGATTVMLDDLVRCLLGTATLDQDVAGAEGRDGIYSTVSARQRLKTTATRQRNGGFASPSQTSRNHTLVRVQEPWQ